MTLITNCYDASAVRPRLPVETVFLYQPKEEWTYSHHASITFFKGRYYAIWSNGRAHEDYPGQRVLIADSPDFLHWSEPKSLVGPLMGKHSELILTAAGFHQYNGVLTAYYGAYEYTQEEIAAGTRNGRGHQDTRLWAMTSRDGETWSEPLDMIAPVVPNHGPQSTHSGRLIISGNISFPYTDDPAGLSGWTMTGIYPPEMKKSIVDDSESFWWVQAKMDWPAGLCEGAFFQTDDDVLHMMLRTTGPGFTGKLWQTESSDDGATWAQPVASDFTDNNTKFHFGRLPDGRFYYVGSPDPQPRGARCPLVLSLSDDGLHFNRHFILADAQYSMAREGLHKGGMYGYPHTLVHQGALHVIYSLRKEAVQVLRVDMRAIEK
jgi:hypothetical protein